MRTIAASAERRARWGAASLAGLSLASAAMLVGSPLFAIGASPLTFGATDAAASLALDTPSPSVRTRVVARALAAAAWGGAASTSVALRGSELGAAGFRPTLLAIFLAVGTVVGAFGTGSGAARPGAPPRTPGAEAPMIGVLDVTTAAWSFFLALAAHEADARTRATMTLGVALALGLRALLVARVVRSGRERPDDARLSALGFVGWIALAGTSCACAPTPVTWSGLGAAVLLTLAAALAEARRKRPFVLFLRGSLAFAFAAMLGVSTFLSS